MRRVVVTGLGIVSSIGNNAEEVTDSLRHARSGIVTADDYVRLGFRSQVHGSLKIDLDAGGRSPRPPLPGRWRRLLLGGDEPGDRRCRADGKRDFQSAHRADRGLGRALAPRPSSPPPISPAIPNKGPKRIGPFAVPKAMSSTCSANLSTWFKTKGVNYSISSRLLDLGQLHRQCHRDDPVGQAGHDVRRRRRGAGLDA